MRRHAPLVVASLLLAPALARAQSTRGPLGPEVLRRLAPLRDAHHLPALAGAVVQGRETMGIAAVGSRALGAPDAVTVDDPWHLGSCTKAMTATLIGRLVERGLLRWETTLAEVYPDLAPGMDPAWRAVTLEQLLSHRAGAPADLFADDLWKTLWTDRTRTLPQLRRLVVETVTRRPPAFAPGTAFLYSNGGVIMAGAVAERVTGRPWEDLLREEVFAPLGIEGGGFGPPGTEGTVDAPWGHRGAGEALVAIDPGTPGADNPPALGPAGTVHLPLAGWARFAAAHLAGERGAEGLLLRPETFATLHRPRGEEGYALGWGRGERPWAGGTILTHAGSNSMWFCTVVLAPDADVAALVCTNQGGPEAEGACAEAAKALVELVRFR
jgi:CubicO group peptidase (beta-lactamase class C family)